MRLLNSPVLSDEDETTMNKLICTPGLWMNEGSGRDLLKMAKHWIQVYREAKVSCVVSVILHPGIPQTMLIQLFRDNSSCYRKYQYVGRIVDPPTLCQHLSQTVMNF